MYFYDEFDLYLPNLVVLAYYIYAYKKDEFCPENFRCFVAAVEIGKLLF